MLTWKEGCAVVILIVRVVEFARGWSEVAVLGAATVLLARKVGSKEVVVRAAGLELLGVAAGWWWRWCDWWLSGCSSLGKSGTHVFGSPLRRIGPSIVFSFKQTTLQRAEVFASLRTATCSPYC